MLPIYFLFLFLSIMIAKFILSFILTLIGILLSLSFISLVFAQETCPLSIHYIFICIHYFSQLLDSYNSGNGCELCHSGIFLFFTSFLGTYNDIEIPINELTVTTNCLNQCPTGFYCPDGIFSPLPLCS